MRTPTILLFLLICTSYTERFVVEASIAPVSIQTGAITKQTQLNLNQLIKDEIKRIEAPRGPHLQAYWDYKQWSIGYGTKSPCGNCSITAEQAEQLFETVYARTVASVEKFYPRLTGGQKAAVISLYYNLGRQLMYSTRTNSDIKAGRKPKFEAWVYAGGKSNKGLLKRRRIESAIWDDWIKYFSER